MDGKSVDAPVGAGARWPVCRLPVRRSTALRCTKLPAAASLPGRGPARMDDVSQGPGGDGNHMLLLSKAMGAEGEAAPCLPVGHGKEEGKGRAAAVLGLERFHAKSRGAGGVWLREELLRFTGRFWWW